MRERGHRFAGARRTKDGTELLGRRGAPGGLERLEDRSDLLESPERKGSVPQAKRDRLVGLREQAPNLGLLLGGVQRQERRPSGRRSGQGRDEAKDDVELESVSVDVVRGRETYGVARFSSESLRSIFLRAWIILRLRLALGFS